MMTNIILWISLLYLCFVLKHCESTVQGTCADLMYLENRRKIEHGVIKTVTGDDKTGIVLRETLLQSDNNVYFAYVSPICKIGNFYRYNCLALKTFSSYDELKQNNYKYCYDKEVRINAECRMASIRIVGGALLCELEPGNYATKPRIAKINITTGEIIKSRELTNAKQTTLCLKTRENDWNPNAQGNLGDVTVHTFVDRGTTWIMYESATDNTKSIVENINSDLSTIATLTIAKISSSKRVIMICGKLYIMSPSSSTSLSISKAVDIYNPNNKMEHLVKFIDNLPASTLESWIHYNPKLEEIFVGVKNKDSYVYSVVKCHYSYSDTASMDFTDLKSTFLWSLRANEPDQKTDMVDTLVSYFRLTNVTLLDYISKNLLICPPKSCAFDLNTPTTQYCRIKSAITTLKIYSDYKHIKPESNKMLQIHFHIDRLLNQQNFKTMSTQISFLKDFLSKNFMELRLKVNEFRNSVGTYYHSLADFDSSTAKSDLELIYRYLGEFKNKSDDITSTLYDDINILAKEAEVSAGLEIFGKTNLLITASLAFANPIEAVADTTGAVLTMAEKIDELTAALKKMAKYVVLKGYLPELTTMNDKMKQKIQENADKYKTVRDLVRAAYDQNLNDTFLMESAAKFLQEYDTYEPGYLPSSITRIEEMVNAIVEEMCEVVFSGETTPSAIAQAQFHNKGTCFNTKLKVKSLMAIYHDMYDKQDELFDAFRSAVRSLIAKHNSERIQTIQNKVNQDLLTWTHVNLKVFTMELFISSEVHRLVLIHEACNLIRYKNADVMPDYCRNTIIYPHGASFDRVLSYRYDADMCGNDKIERYVSIPAIELTSNVTLQNGTIDLIALYQGNETTFKIPNKQWLVQNGWITADENPKMIILKNFELYLPMHQNTSTVTPVSVRTSLRLSGANDISPGGGVSYNFNDIKKYLYNFRYGQKHSSCDNPMTTNLPYEIPHCTKPASICVTSQGTVNNAVFYPSIYARWFLSAHVTGTLLQPKPKGNFNLIASVAICFVNPEKVTRGTEGDTQLPLRQKETKTFDKRTAGVCCATSGKYYDRHNTSNKCQACPQGSQAKLQGYFCEKI